MTLRIACTLALAVVLLGPAWQSSAQVRADDEQLVRDFLNSIGASAYTVEPIRANYVSSTFPGTSFFSVWFRQWPIAVQPPEGLGSSNVFYVEDGVVWYMTGFWDLWVYFYLELAPVRNEEEANNAGRTWLRLTQEFSQDGFYRFSAPMVDYVAFPGGSVTYGQVLVTGGGTGEIGFYILFGEQGQFLFADEARRVLMGNRPICQATKLLDVDPLVRRMAEQDILVMGSAVKPYLDEQRAKAKPELQAAIDRIWQQIVKEGR